MNGHGVLYICGANKFRENLPVTKGCHSPELGRADKRHLDDQRFDVSRGGTIEQLKKTDCTVQ